MTQFDFEKLTLRIGQSIWFMDGGGVGFNGSFQGDYDMLQQTFLFANFGNGQNETIDISSLQRLEKTGTDLSSASRTNEF